MSIDQDDRRSPAKPSVRTRACIALVAAALVLASVGCVPASSSVSSSAASDGPTNSDQSSLPSTPSNEQVPDDDDERGVVVLDENGPRYRDFLMDQTIDVDGETVHYNVLVPGDLDFDRPISLFVTLPGYQGLYFQGIGQNLYTEDFAFTAQGYQNNMIVLAPQLSDWGAASAEQAIALVERFQKAYGISPDNTFAEGYSGGGETLSIVLGMRPDLFSRALVCSTQWDGDLAVLADAEVPVYMVVGEGDEYYSSAPLQSAYEELRELYLSKGLPDSRIGQLVTLDVKDATYFTSRGVANQHGGGGQLFSNDASIMGWLFYKE